jgi:hypothetical protein
MPGALPPSSADQATNSDTITVLQVNALRLIPLLCLAFSVSENCPACISARVPRSAKVCKGFFGTLCVLKHSGPDLLSFILAIGHK